MRAAGAGAEPWAPPQADLGEPCLGRAPLPGLYEHRGHAGRGVQDLVDLHLRPAVHTVPLARVARGQVVHHRKLVVPAALGAEPDLVPMVLDLGLVPQRRLDLHGRGETRETHGMFPKGPPCGESILGRRSFPPDGRPRLPRGPKGGDMDSPTHTRGQRICHQPQAGSHSPRMHQILHFKKRVKEKQRCTLSSCGAIGLVSILPSFFPAHGESTLGCLHMVSTEAHATRGAGDRSRLGRGLCRAGAPQHW